MDGAGTSFAGGFRLRGGNFDGGVRFANGGRRFDFGGSFQKIDGFGGGWFGRSGGGRGDVASSDVARSSPTRSFFG